MTTKTYNIPNISCGHCVNTIQMEVGELAGVTKVVASNDTKTAVVEFGDPATEDQIVALLKEINYAPVLN
jgi:copper chaperone CopZ